MQTVTNLTISRKLSPSRAFSFAIPLLAPLRTTTIPRCDSSRGRRRGLSGRDACLIYSTGASVYSADTANGNSCSSRRHPWERAVG